MFRLKLLLLILAFLGGSWNASAADTTQHEIQVLFLHGSKPARGHKKTESSWFGGIHGGHVSIVVRDSVYGFGPMGRFHIIAHSKACHSAFTSNSARNWRPGTSKYTVFAIPIDSTTERAMLATLWSYLNESPYDYAFLGMRCAAASADVLGQHGIIKKRGRFRNTFRFFYPKKLRKRLYKLSKRHDWKITKYKGRDSRKWEKDPKRYRELGEYPVEPA